MTKLEENRGIMEHRHRQRNRALRTLVDDRVDRWNSSKKPDAEPAPEPKPIVTVAREPGAGGEEFARLIADKLGFDLWDRELVQQIAEREGAHDALIASLDERVQSRLEEFVDGLLMPQGTMSEYLRQLGGVIRGLAEKGNSVIVGRGGQFLAEGERALRVRVVSPRQARVQRYAERHELGPREAASMVKKLERERHSFYSRYFGGAEDDPTLYDIVVNVDALGFEAACAVVMAAYCAKFDVSV